MRKHEMQLKFSFGKTASILLFLYLHPGIEHNGNAEKGWIYAPRPSAGCRRLQTPGNSASRGTIVLCSMGTSKDLVFLSGESDIGICALPEILNKKMKR